MNLYSYILTYHILEVHFETMHVAIKTYSVHPDNSFKPM